MDNQRSIFHIQRPVTLQSSSGRGWANWPDASEIESTIESKSSPLCSVTYALVWVNGRCPSSPLRPFHFFPFSPFQPRSTYLPLHVPRMSPRASKSFLRVLRTYSTLSTFSHPNPLCWQQRVYVWLSPMYTCGFLLQQMAVDFLNARRFLWTRLMGNNSIAEK